MNRHYIDLVAAYLEGTLAGGEREELLSLLRGNRDLMDDFLGQVHRHRQMQIVLGEDPAVAQQSEERIRYFLRASGSDDFLDKLHSRAREEAVAETPAWWRRPAWLAAAAAVVAVVIGGWLWNAERGTGSAEGGVVARVEQCSVFGVQCSGKALKVGDEVRAGAKIETGAGGRVKLAWVGEDTTVELDGSSKLEIGNSKWEKLATGRFTATVAKQQTGKPFVVETPLARATVLGTTFALAADAQSTELRVMNGRVQLTRLSDDRRVEVVAGEHVVIRVGEAGPDAPCKQTEKAGHVVRSFPLTNSVSFSSLAAGDRVLWLADRSRRLLKVDPATGREIGSLNLDFPCISVEWDGEKLWGADYGSVKVHAIDPVTGRIRMSLSVPTDEKNSVRGVTFGAGSLWVANREEIFRIDPRDGRLLKKFQLNTPCVQLDIAYFSGALWRRDFQTIGERHLAEICRIDPETGAVLQRIGAPTVVEGETGNHVLGLAEADPGRMWTVVSPSGDEVIQELYLIEYGGDGPW